ncbi:X-Pro dipeptidyl-peptidase [Sphaerisporangium melleum]|uniref:X-Pro dipeptidyl-peptidase n=1 Tax=Sphaerisporangium melleum TaxID=321316 RepID=A0A917REN5_9ACTN|nr:CocE/NonD family hydrolase [Sphaerisporangium melleum]GGL02325.1 X-Pro dipeptidyl-peptidase [Sphaerisporangium melleum]GII72235.1 X-Pro dipeptidyl-peptidase [Sphaerisporangium melleum]
MTALGRLAERMAPLPPATSRRVRVERGLRIPMDDGATLLADHWAPRETRAGSLSEIPVVVVRTAYGRGGPLGWLYGPVLAERGLQVLIVSTRGTFGSDGEFLAMRNERADGLATLRWLAGQPWSSGQVILAGSSYFGYTQWAIADALPPEVKAMVPHITSSRLALGLMRPGRVDLETITNFSWNTAPQRRDGSSLPAAQERRGYLLRSMVGADRRRIANAMNTLPVTDVDQALLGRTSEFFQQIVRHDPDSTYLEGLDRSGTVADVTVPVSSVTGWYDIFLADQLQDFTTLVDAGRKPRLTVGPWWHADPRGMGASIAQVVEWGSAVATGQEPPPRAPVRLYVMGADEWRDFASWPPTGYEPRQLHLRADGTLAGTAGSAAPPSTFIYDPNDPTPSLGGAKLNPTGAGSVDNRKLEERPDVLTFTGAPLTDDLEVIGQVTAEVWVGANRPSTDVFVRLCDVDPRGTSLNVCDDLVHVDTDGATRATVHLSPTAYRFKKGHRLRVQVSAGAFPRFARNLGGGEPAEHATTAHTTTFELFHDEAHPSAVTIPAR